MAAFDRLVVAFNGKSIGACDQNEVRIVAGVLHGADLLCHLGLRDDRLVVIVAATLGEDLVLQMASRDTGALEGAHRMLGIESVAVTGVRVSDHRDIDGIDDRLEPADDLGQAPQTPVGYAHAAGPAAAGDVYR